MSYENDAEKPVRIAPIHAGSPVECPACRSFSRAEENGKVTCRHCGQVLVSFTRAADPEANYILGPNGWKQADFGDWQDRASIHPGQNKSTPATKPKAMS